MKQHTFLAMMILCGIWASLSGCASNRSLQIEPMGKKGTVIAPDFSESYYYFDQDHTLFFVMRSHGMEKGTGTALDQVVTFRIFWRPVGGRTSMDPTALNATYRYAVMTPTAVGMYEGAGFVRLWGADGVHKMKARLIGGDLRLTESSAGFVDTIGRSRMEGSFRGTFDDAKALDLSLGAHREFFLRSMGKTMKEPAATMPVATRGASVNFPTEAMPMSQPATRP